MWLAHALNTVYNYTVKVPVIFKNLPQNKKSLVEMPQSLFVQVKASGLKLCLILLNRPFVPLEVDFNNLKTINRNQSYILSSGDIDFKKSFKFETLVKHISPDTLYFAEKTGYQKIVPIKIPLSIKCKAGYGYRQPVISPNLISIWGDTVLIKKIDTIYTQPLNLTEMDRDVSENLQIIKPNKDVYTTVSETNVKIEILKLIEQTLILPVNAINQQNNKQVNIFPSKVKVKFTCLQNSFDMKDSSLFRIAVNSEKINLTTKKTPVFLSASPANITLMSIEPKEVEILIIKK